MTYYDLLNKYEQQISLNLKKKEKGLLLDNKHNSNALKDELDACTGRNVKAMCRAFMDDFLVREYKSDVDIYPQLLEYWAIYDIGKSLWEGRVYMMGVDVFNHIWYYLHHHPIYLKITKTGHLYYGHIIHFFATSKDGHRLVKIVLEAKEDKCSIM